MLNRQQLISDLESSKKLRGSVKITHGRGDEILSVYEAKNFVVLNAAAAVKDLLINAWSGAAAPYLARMAIGTGGYSGAIRRTPDATWHTLTDLFTPLYSKDFTTAVSSSLVGNVWTVTNTCKFQYGEDTSPTTKVNEVGLILKDATGGASGIVNGGIAAPDKLFAYRTFTERDWDAAGTYIDVVWTIYIDRT